MQYPLGGLGGVVEWGHETKNNPTCPRSSRHAYKNRDRCNGGSYQIIMIRVYTHFKLF